MSQIIFTGPQKEALATLFGEDLEQTMQYSVVKLLMNENRKTAVSICVSVLSKRCINFAQPAIV